VTVVADAGPLMALPKLDLLSLLPELYSQVLIPATVYDEVVLRGIAAG
jgi:hypothetical protein